MALATERIKFIVDVDTSAFVKGVRAMADDLNDFAQTGNRINIADAVGDQALNAAKRYYSALKDITKATSDLTEATNFSQKVFREASAGVEEFAENAAKIGFSKTQALNAAAALGVFGRTAGLAGDELVDFTTELVTLAADMASIKNTKPEEAVVALGAALRSEYEPLRRYGVVLNDVQLRERAFALGIYDGTGALNSQQRILAARAEVMDQLGFAMGDFVDTSDEFANSQRVLAANVENLKAAIGQGLLPVFKGLTDMATAVVSIFNSMPDSLKETAGSAAVVGVAFLALLGTILKLRAAFATLQTLTASGSVFGALFSALAGPAGVAAGLSIAALAVIPLIAAFGKARRETELTSEAMKRFNDILGEIGDVENPELALAEFLRQELEQSVAVLEQVKGRTLEIFVPLKTQLDELGIDFLNFSEFIKQSLEIDDEGFALAIESMRDSIRSTGAPPAAIAAMDELLEKLIAMRPELKATFAVYQEEVKAAGLEQLELNKQIARQSELLEKNRKSAVQGLQEARQALVGAQLTLLDAQQNQQEQLAKDIENYNRSVDDQTRAIERQSVSVEQAYRSVADAQRGVIEAQRAEARAIEQVERAYLGVAEAQEKIVEANEEATEAQKEFAKATRDVELAMRGYGAGSREAADALEEVDDAQRKLRGSQLSLEDSALSLQDAQEQLNRLRRFYGQTSSPSAIRRIADAERAVARAQLDHEDAVDSLESANADLNETQTDYQHTVSGYPRESERVVRALEDQEAASDNLERAIKNVDNANRQLVDSQRAVEDAQYAAGGASRAVQDAHRQVEDSARNAGWAQDDLRRATHELAAYQASGQPTAAMDTVTRAEWALYEASKAVKDAIREQKVAEQELDQFRRERLETIFPGFQTGTQSFVATHNFNIDVRGLATDPIATGKFIAETLENYLRSTGQAPLHGSVWR